MGERKDYGGRSSVRTLEDGHLGKVAPVYHLGGIHSEGSQDANEAHTIELYISQTDARTAYKTHPKVSVENVAKTAVKGPTRVS